MTIPVMELRGGELVPVEMPIYGKPGTVRIWRKVMDGLRSIIKDLGWREECLLLGTSGDCWPSPATVRMFKKIAPEVRWRAITHGNGVPRWGMTAAERTQPNGMVAGYLELVRRITNGRLKVPDCPVTCNTRDCVKARPFEYRSLPATNVISANFDGICWKGLDYWEYQTQEGKKRSALNTYVHFGNIVGSTPRTMAAPGPEGAVATVQFEMLKEGIQDAEAMLFIRRVLGNPELRRGIAEKTARRARAAIEDMLCLLETGLRYSPQGGADVRRHVNRLHCLAAKVEAASKAVKREGSERAF